MTRLIKIWIRITSVIVITIAMGGLNVFASNYPHDKTGRQFPAFLYEQELSQSTGKTQLENLHSEDLNFSVSQKEQDNRGSQVGNVRNFTVDMNNDLLPPDKAYVLVYYVDDVPVMQFENVRLPFHFTRDFRGHRPGLCVIKIDIEDTEGNLLVTRTTTITVKP